MAQEYYAFDVGAIEDVPDDPKIYHKLAWRHIEQIHPMFDKLKGRRDVTLTYLIYEVYATGNISLRLFLMSKSKERAAAIKLILP